VDIPLIALGVIGLLVAARVVRRRRGGARPVARRARAPAGGAGAGHGPRRRARLRVDVLPASHSSDYIGGVLHSDAPVAAVRLCLRIANDGDREAGTTTVVVRIPVQIEEAGIRWADADAVGSAPHAPAREDGSWVLRRRLQGVAPGATEELLLSLNVRPPGTGIARWPLTVTVVADDAEPPPPVEHGLAVARFKPLT
jgi:hypothetical protein